MNRLLAAGALLIGLHVGPAYADRFENAYLAFDLPKGWTCHAERVEFVCEPTRPAGAKADAIMILAAKLAGPGDSLAAYRRHLEQDPPATGRGTISVPAHVVTIDNTLWVDATLLGSEAPNYFTRYLATSRDSISVLFTFSAHRTRYDALVGAALQAVYSLQLKDTWRDQR